MITIHLDGERMEVGEQSTLVSLLPHHPSGCCVGIIRPATKEQAKTGNLAMSTTAGEITIEITRQTDDFLKSSEIVQKLNLHWADRYATAFGPFPSSIHPLRKPHVYERGDVILGCGGIPAFAHLPMILGSDKTRLSKRHGATSVTAYQEMGYLPDSFITYLARLGWAHGDQEVFTKDELVEYFSLEDVGKSAAVFNPEKLLWLNSQYIQEHPNRKSC